MKTTPLLTLAASVSALAIQQRDDSPPPFFGMTSHSGNVTLHLRPIVAHYGKLMFGTDTTSYCPDSVAAEGACPQPGNGTAYVYTTSTSTVEMDASIPGGQQVYIACTGNVMYSPPHGSVPVDGVTEGFTYNPPKMDGQVGVLDFKGTTGQGDADGFVACPSQDIDGAWELFAAAPAVSSDCPFVGFITGSVQSDAAIAYEYLASK